MLIYTLLFCLKSLQLYNNVHYYVCLLRMFLVESFCKTVARAVYSLLKMVFQKWIIS